MFDLDRIMGVITLKAPIYRQIADDQTATSQAAIIVVIAMLVRGFFSGLFKASADGTFGVSVVGAIVGAIVILILGLVGWWVAAWVLQFVAGMFGGKTNTGEMLRVTGYVQVFSLVAVLNILALISPALLCIVGLIGLIVLVLSIIGYVIGVREAAEFSTTNAIITAIIAAVVNFIIVGVIGGAITAMVG
jgi:hypothetical protein